MDRSSRPSWRKKGRSPAQPQGRPAMQTQVERPASSWRSRRTDAAQTAVFYQRLRLLGLSLAALGLVVAFVLALVWTGKETPILAVRVLTYAPAFPPNSYADEDLRRLVRVDGGNKNIRVLRDEASRDWRGSQYLEHLQQQLAAHRPGGPRKDVRLVLLSAHGVVNEANQPCLLFSDAQPLDSRTWLPLEDLLEVLRSHQTQGRRQHKLLLVLDAGRIDDCWSAGLLYNGFAERLREVVQTAAVPGLYVLNAAGPGQIAWAAPELEGTPFGYFLAKGLDGHAASGDNVITLGELVQYVQRNVAGWTLLHRASSQQPMLVPELEPQQDFEIAYAGKTTPSSDEPPVDSSSELAATQDKILRLWEEYDGARAAQKLTRHDPLRLAELQHQLLRAEQLLWAGGAYRGELSAAISRVQARLDEAPAAHWPAGIAGLSLPLALQFGPPGESGAQRAELLAAWQAAGGRPVPKEGEPSPPPVSYLAAADIGTRWLAGLPQASPDQLQDVLDFVGSSLPRPDMRSGSGRSAGALPELIEVQFLTMLLRYLDWTPGGAQEAALAQAVPRAIAARRAAEQSAAPPDVHTWLWIQPLVESADQNRREIEDLLFAGGAEEAPRLHSRYEQLLEVQAANESYPAALARAAEISGFYAVRDAAWSELPYLAQWLIRQPMRTPLEVLRQDSAKQLDQLRGLIAATRQLSAELDRCLIEQAAEPSAELRLAAGQVQQLHEELRRDYLQFCNYLEQAGEDRLTLNRIGDALRVPLVDAKRRTSLTRIYTRILFAPDDLKPAAQAAVDRPVAGSSGARQDPFDRYGQSLAGWERHPALAIVDRGGLNLLREAVVSSAASELQAADGLPWIARQGGLMRQQLSRVPADLNELERVSRQRLALADETPANTRAGLSQADRLARAVAGLSGAVAGGGLAPVQQLRLVDLHFLLLGHSWRVLEDFWGPGERADVDAYFAEAAAAYLRSARLADNTPRSLRHAQVDLNRLLAARRQAARQVALQVEDALTLQTDKTAPHQLQVRWNIAALEGASAADERIPASLPGGVAAVYLEIPATTAAGRRLLAVRDATDQHAIRRYPLAAPGEGPLDVPFRLPLAELESSGAGADLDAFCLYRGHLYRQRFRVLWPPWVTSVEVTPQPPSRASITVDGEGQRTGHIMFVFDCSGSMTIGGRMQTAKRSLRQVLDALLTGARCEVGLRVYGRRAKFTDRRDLTKRQFVDDAWTDRVHPDTDVERLVPLRTLDQAHHAAILAKLDELQPFGQTPLYLAVKLALDEGDFRSAGADEPKRLVVITDGVNLQTQLIGPSMQEVLDTQRGRGSDVQIDIVGLDVEADLKPEERGKLAELKQLAKSTGGDYYSANDGESLVQALQKALQLVEYSVSGPGGISDGVLRRNLGVTWPLRDVPLQPTTYDVRLVGIDRAPSALVQIEGGEALLLRYDASKNRLFYPRYEPQRYDRSDARRGPAQICDDPAGSGSYTVQALLPRRKARDVAFYVYLQHQHEQTFTHRPKHVRAEIRPVGSYADRVYYFSDPDFLPDRPVPVLRFLAQDWPASAAEADLKLWVKFDPQGTPPEWKGQVDPLRTQRIQLADLPQVSFEISSKSLGRDAYSVIVTEGHPLAGPVQPARVRATPPPDELIRHEYAGMVNVLKHEFRYSRPTPVEIDISSRKQLLHGALEADSMRIKVEE